MNDIQFAQHEEQSQQPVGNGTLPLPGRMLSESEQGPETHERYTLSANGISCEVPMTLSMKVERNMLQEQQQQRLLTDSEINTRLVDTYLLEGCAIPLKLFKK